LSKEIFFSDLEKVVTSFLGLSKSQQALKNFTWQLGTICDLIKHTHLLVINKLEQVENAQSLEEAKTVINNLERTPLTDIFRANHLCDIFVGFGMELQKIIKEIVKTDPTLISNEQINTWARFGDSLMRREGEVAYLYADLLQNLGNLASNSSSGADLAKLKDAALEAKKILTAQVADFDYLANEFRKIPKVV